MFTHKKAGQTYYSIVEKIKHYTDIGKGKKQYKNVTKTYARKRLKELEALHKRDFFEPELVIVNDSVFGNKGSKPRLSVVVATHENEVRVSPIHDRRTNALILDNYLDKQLDEKGAWVGRNELYETKYIYPIAPLTSSDKKKIKLFYGNTPYKKKKTTSY